MKRLYSFIALFFLFTGSLFADDQIQVNNRILAIVNGKTISVLDVMKKMDVMIKRYSPETASSPQMRFQFYTASWRQTLEQLVNTELMMADADKLELQMSDSDVHEEFLNRFGPNVHQTLDEMHLSYDEAYEMTRQDMMVQRVVWFRIQLKALQNVGPQDVKVAFKEYCKEFSSGDDCKYRVLSIRSKNEAMSKALAARAYELLEQKRADPNTVVDAIKKEAGEEIAVQWSPEYEVNTAALSASHKEALTSLKVGDYSEPLSQTSRNDQSSVSRIFYLKDRIKKALPSFEQMEAKIKDALLDKEFEKQQQLYITKLRERAGYNNLSESLPADFQPFTLL